MKGGAYVRITWLNANDQKFSRAPPARELFRWYKNIDEQNRNVGEDFQEGDKGKNLVGIIQR